MHASCRRCSADAGLVFCPIPEEPCVVHHHCQHRTRCFYQFGLPKNLVDSEQMLGTVREAGFTVVSSDDPADAIVVNTCGLESSKEESLQVIREAIARRDRGEAKRVVVAGCLVQRHRAKILDWVPGIDAMVGVLIVTESWMRSAGWIVSLFPMATPPLPIGSAATAPSCRGPRSRHVGLTVHGKDGQGIGYWEAMTPGSD